MASVSERLICIVTGIIDAYAPVGIIENAFRISVSLARNCYIKGVMKRTFGYRVRQFLWAAAICTISPLFTAHAQEASEQQPDDANPIEEIIVSVDRYGKPVDIDALRLEEARLEIIRTFDFHQYKEEQEEFRLKLRSATSIKYSRFAWGYDAQTEAAQLPNVLADYLPMDRVKPATIVSFRF